MFDPDYALFATIMRTGSLSAAGRSLSVSPAMVSKRLARLETRLGVRLLHRTTRRLVPTQAGERFYADVERIMEQIAEAEKRASGRSGTVAGPFRISAPTSFGRLHVAPYLKIFLDAHPQLELEVDLSDSFVDLVAARIDVAVRITASVEAGLVAHPLAASRRILCASPDYVKARGVPGAVEALGDHHLLAAEGQLPWRLTGDAGPLTVRGRSRVATNSSEVVRELCVAGAGIALRSLWDVSTELANGRLLRILPDVEGSSETNVVAVHPRSGQPSPAVAAFITFMKDLYSPRPPWET